MSHALHITRHVLHITFNYNYLRPQSVDKHPVPFVKINCPAVQFQLRSSIKVTGPNLQNTEMHCPVVLSDRTFGLICVILT
jgi:predicted ArsR family transcriptional regulator